MKRVGTFITGLLVGATLFGGIAAYAAGIMAEQRVKMNGGWCPRP